MTPLSSRSVFREPSLNMLATMSAPPINWPFTYTWGKVSQLASSFAPVLTSSSANTSKCDMAETPHACSANPHESETAKSPFSSRTSVYSRASGFRERAAFSES